MKCEVCLEAFTKELRRKIQCPYCEYSACSQCHQRYLLGSSEYAHCMSCRKVWNREILFNNFTDKFVNKTYKKWREEILFEREKSFMPDTQPFVETEIEIRSVQREMENIRKNIGLIYQKAQETCSAPVELFATEDGSWTTARIERYRQFCNIRKEAAILELDLKFMDNKIAELQNKKPSSEKRKFIRSCPADGCAGFLSTAWKCGLCKVNVCNKCHEIKSDDDEHICDAANIQTAELLAKDSKTCPTCAALIFKISGCDQIWCTQCHTAFNWRTQQVEKGVIHNPHYYDYMRQHGGLPRAAGDIPCGGMPDIYSVTSRNHRITYSKEQIEYILAAHRTVMHWNYAGLHRFRQTDPEDFRKIRIQYMLKDITKEEYQKRLQQLEKTDNKNSEIRDVIDLYRTIGTEIFQKIAVQPENNYTSELAGLRDHCNELIEGVKRRWKCSISDAQFY